MGEPSLNLSFVCCTFSIVTLLPPTKEHKYFFDSSVAGGKLSSCDIVIFTVAIMCNNLLSIDLFPKNKSTVPILRRQEWHPHFDVPLAGCLHHGPWQRPHTMNKENTWKKKSRHLACYQKGCFSYSHNKQGDPYQQKSKRREEKHPKDRDSNRMCLWEVLLFWILKGLLEEVSFADKSEGEKE